MGREGRRVLLLVVYMDLIYTLTLSSTTGHRCRRRHHHHDDEVVTLAKSEFLCACDIGNQRMMELHQSFCLPRGSV